MTTKQSMAAIFIGVFWMSLSHAVDIPIKMLDKSNTEGMLAFEPTFVRAQINDTVTFIPTDKGHNSRSLLVVSGTQSWKSAFDAEFSVKLEKEGIYLYICDAHKAMGMVGVIQVGRATNLEEVRQKAIQESAKMVMNKERFIQALNHVQLDTQ